MHVKKSKELDDNSSSKIVSSNTDEGISEAGVWGFLDAAVFEFTAEKMAEGCKVLKEKDFNAARLMIIGDMRKTHNDLEGKFFYSKLENYVELDVPLRRNIINQTSFIEGKTKLKIFRRES